MRHPLLDIMFSKLWIMSSSSIQLKSINFCYTPDCKDSDYSHSVYSTSSYLPDASFSHCRDKNRDKKSTAPESKVEEGSSKRNIVRKSDHDPNRKEKKQGGGGGGKGNWDPIADGSL
jgi:hypothetical protein